MMNAPVGSRWLVSGSRSAIVSAGPIPGRMPITVPSVTPSSDQRRLLSVSAVEKPVARFSRADVMTSPRTALPEASVPVRT